MLNRIELERRKLTAAGKNIIPLYSGHPGDAGFKFPGDILKPVYEKYFRTLDYHPDPKGELAARVAIAAYYARAAAKVDPENIVITSGTSESFLHLFSLLCEPGENILAPHPSYPLFDHLAHMARINLTPYSLVKENGWRLDLQGLKAAINSRTKAIVLISPHNPTGMVVNPDEISFLAKLSAHHQIPLIVDEVFADFYFGDNTYPRLMQREDLPLLFTLNGISKMMALPMLKLGWIAVTGTDTARVKKMVDELETRADALLAAHTPIQKALPDILMHGKLFKENYQREVSHRLDQVCEMLTPNSLFDFTKPEGGFYLTLKIKKDMDEESLVIDFMNQSGFLVHPGYFYDLENGPHLIFSFIHEPSLLKKALAELIAHHL